MLFYDRSKELDFPLLYRARRPVDIMTDLPSTRSFLVSVVTLLLLARLAYSDILSSSSGLSTDGLTGGWVGRSAMGFMEHVRLK